MNELVKHKWKVCVRCLTYNHASYILDALNGFCMQNTNFPFVCTIVDDASTDGEPDVIRCYLEKNFILHNNSEVRIEETDDYHLILAPHKNNQNCYFAVLLLKYNHYQLKKSKFSYIREWSDSAKYIAICEGDDYWINPLKLQRQVDIMDNHSDYTLCASNALTLWDHGTHPASYFKKYYESHIVTMNELIGNWMFATSTLLFRSIIQRDFPSWTKKVYFGDMTLLLIAAHVGRIYVLSDITSVYRKSEDNITSVTRKLSNRMDYVRDQQVILYEEFQKWTNYKYKVKVEQTIKELKKSSKYFKYRQKSRLLPYIFMPLYSIKLKLKL